MHNIRPARNVVLFIAVIALCANCLVRNPPAAGCSPGDTRCNPSSGVAEVCVDRHAWYPSRPLGEGTCPPMQRCCRTLDMTSDGGATIFACTAPDRCI